MKANNESIFNVVLGTAGHIDHGKSTLVRRLTGIDPDRLPEEKDRGLTIDLGFAPWTLSNGLRIGVVDVPGHERLIKNMVAGATGIDLVLLIVAADDSVMPQTREHLTILQVLGMQHGMVAITKVDAVEPDLVELVREEIAETLEGTFLEGKPMVEVSSITGQGFDELERVLEQQIADIRPREERGVFRMPIQRVFSPKGFGTVVTGIPISGTVEVGDRLEIVPMGPGNGGRQGRIRGIQAYKETAERARAGHSAALNLSDIDYREVHRGMVATEPGYFQGSSMLEATLRYLPSTHRPLLHQTEIRLHVGTAEVMGKVFLLDKKTLEPGTESYVQFRLTEPVVTAPGDRYVLRLHSPMETIGGGEILDRSRWRLKTGKAYVLEQLETKKEAVGDEERLLINALETERYSVANEKELSLRCSMALDDCRDLLARLVESGRVQKASRAGQFISVAQLESAEEQSRAFAAEYFRTHTRKLFLDKILLRQELGCHEVFLQDLLGRLEASGEATVESGGLLRWRDFGPKLSDADHAQRDAILERSRAAGCTPPSPTELSEEESWDAPKTQQLFELLAEEGQLQKVADGIYLHAEVLDEARQKLRAFLAEHGQMTASDARTTLGSSRKYMIPLLEHLDREGFTLRKGDVRVLREQA